MIIDFQKRKADQEVVQDGSKLNRENRELETQKNELVESYQNLAEDFVLNIFSEARKEAEQSLQAKNYKSSEENIA